MQCYVSPWLNDVRGVREAWHALRRASGARCAPVTSDSDHAPGLLSVIGFRGKFRVTSGLSWRHHENPHLRKETR